MGGHEWMAEWRAQEKTQVGSGEEGIARIRCHIMHLNGIVQKYEGIGYYTSCLNFDLWWKSPAMCCKKNYVVFLIKKINKENPPTLHFYLIKHSPAVWPDFGNLINIMSFNLTTKLHYWNKYSHFTQEKTESQRLACASQNSWPAGSIGTLFPSSPWLCQHRLRLTPCALGCRGGPQMLLSAWPLAQTSVCSEPD